MSFSERCVSNIRGERNKWENLRNFRTKRYKCLIYKFRGNTEIRIGHINAKNSIVSEVTLKEGTNMT